VLVYIYAQGGGAKRTQIALSVYDLVVWSNTI
jgi:hypothetical protein